jgi:mannose-6-phosphate isomerase-like protein (cupin superfamily)
MMAGDGIHLKEEAMKLGWVAIALFTTTGVVAAAGGASGVTYINHEKVAAALSKGGALVSAPDLLVSGSHREKPGQVEVHEKETDVMYVVEGAATLETGGTVVGGKTTRPGQLLGSGITGGQTHRLTAGDVIVIPAGTPHWFKEVPKSISYYVVKVLKQ